MNRRLWGELFSIFAGFVTGFLTALIWVGV